MMPKVEQIIAIFLKFGVYLGLLCAGATSLCIDNRNDGVRNSITKEGKETQMLKVGTVFTGIGAFEKALLQLGNSSVKL